MVGFERDAGKPGFEVFKPRPVHMTFGNLIGVFLESHGTAKASKHPGHGRLTEILGQGYTATGRNHAKDFFESRVSISVLQRTE